MKITKWYDEKLFAQWSNENNALPCEVSKGSDKRIWWECSFGHKWQATIINRLKGSDCPYCSGRMATDKNNLKLLHARLSDEWYFEKNYPLCSTDVREQSNKKVWWVCAFGHEWEAIIYNRVKGTNCPFCEGKKATPETSILQFPLLLKQWSVKNTIKPEDLLPKSSKKVWWTCSKGHEYEASVASRVHMNSGCPFCAWQVSKLQLRIYYELKFFFNDVKLSDKSYGFEIDVFLPKQKIAIEVDGWYWHKDKVEADKKKNERICLLGFTPLRLRGLPLNLLGENDISFKKSENQHSVVFKTIKQIETIIKTPLTYNPQKWNNDEEFLKFIMKQGG